MNILAEVCVYVCFLCAFTAGSHGPLLWVILPSWTGRYSPLPERYLKFWSKLCRLLEESPEAWEEGERWWCLAMVGRCGEARWRTNFTPFLRLCDWSCFCLTLCRDFRCSPRSACCAHWVHPPLAVYHPTPVLQQDRELCSISSQPTYPTNKFSLQSGRESGFIQTVYWMKEWLIFSCLLIALSHFQTSTLSCFPHSFPQGTSYSFLGWTLLYIPRSYSLGCISLSCTSDLYLQLLVVCTKSF